MNKIIQFKNFLPNLNNKSKLIICRHNYSNYNTSLLFENTNNNNSSSSKSYITKSNNNNNINLLKSYTKGPTEPKLLTLTIGEALDDTVVKYGNKEALVVPFQNVRYSWKDLKEQVDNVAKTLINMGIEHGDRIGIMSPNRSEWIVSQLAIQKIGAILVNINPAYRLSELEYCLKQSSCKWVICPDSYKTSDYFGMMDNLVGGLANHSSGEIKCDKLPDLRGIIGLTSLERETRHYRSVLPWDKFIGLDNTSVSERDLLDRVERIQFDEPANIQFTSGTTGLPKGATLSHYNILNNGYMVGEGLGLNEHDKLVIPVPLFHCFGMVMGNNAAMTHGSTLIYPSPTFNAEQVLKAIANERATVLHGVPTMFIAQLEHPDLKKYDLSSLRTGIMSGTTCPIEVMRRVMKDMHMEQVQICYGMTETSPVSLQTSPTDEIDKKVSTVGRTGPHLETKIVDQEGKIVPIGTVGELCTRGYGVMLGYWKNKEATSQSIDPAGWMHTGDLATMDAQGYISIVGRNKDMIIRGGENIYPRELEEFFYTHKSISDVQVIGVPDTKYGECVVAWVILHPNHTVTAEELKNYCKDNIAHYKIPKHFKFVTEFPMTASGKVQKYKMREITIEEFQISK
ncbi:hypothetical protein CYY_003258 [Polysphondylium violaceum]|uniref:Uncharacterized protein n=1 Tax=Polysphondylium violaceum TaxID=133409 RepID=A0A8J4PZZ2_9MYCE|nr:hypothetical protein CYY_003258 [Polysphondylium violaceum]